MMNRAALLLLLVLCLPGCGDVEQAREAARTMSGGNNSEFATKTLAGDNSDSIPPASDTTAETQTSERRIIYTATIELVVKKLSDTEHSIKTLVADSGGHVSEFHQDRRYGDQLQSRWVLRIPVDQFDGFVDSVAEMGVPETRTIESLEVTKQFRDLTSRLNNKQRTEQEFQKLLSERTKTIDDIANIADKLDKVREEIELLEGELRFLSDRIALTTVTILAREDKNYTPPQAPTFGTELKDTFGGSLNNLLAFGKNCVLFVVAIGPWLPLLLLIAIPVWRILRFKRRRPCARNSGATNPTRNS